MRHCPSDLSIEIPGFPPTPVRPVIEAATAVAPTWGALKIEERCERMKAAQSALAGAKEELAKGIAFETGKPLTEAIGEVGAVIAKIDLTIADARDHFAPKLVADGPNPSLVRRVPMGVATVISPFNFPLHLGHGATVAHLLAGNPVVLKPSPLADHVVSRYAEIMAASFPGGVFQVVHGGADEAIALATDARTRAICFTGSVTAGRALSRAVADDFSKELALELGGRNASIICADADLDAAADAVADGLCLTCGQRCNATSRVLVDQTVERAFLYKLLASLSRYVPGDPMLPETKLGPLVSGAALERYKALTAAKAEWLLPGGVVESDSGKRGYFVLPAVRHGFADDAAEPFAPILEVERFSAEDDAVSIANASPYGLTASIFTRDEARFHRLAAQLRTGNVYANLPTTFSPGTLPFGGFGLSGNGRPGGRGFIRFCTHEQAQQWKF